MRLLIGQGQWFVCGNGHRIWKALRDIWSCHPVQSKDFVGLDNAPPPKGGLMDPNCPVCGELWVELPKSLGFGPKPLYPAVSDYSKQRPQQAPTSAS